MPRRLPLVAVLALLALLPPGAARPHGSPANEFGIKRAVIPEDDPKIVRWVIKLEVVRDVPPRPVPEPALARQVLAMINRERAARRLPDLAWHQPLVPAAARPHTERMQEEGHLYHNPDLHRQLQLLDADFLGENVGAGRTVEALHAAFMRSPTHRANVLDPAYRYAAAYVLRDIDGSLWVTVNVLTPLPAGTTS